MLEVSPENRVSSAPLTVPTAAEGLLILDETNTIVYANDVAAACLGYVPAMLMGTRYEQLCNMPAVALNGRPQNQIETELRHKNGRFLPVQLTRSRISVQSPHSLITFTSLADIKQRNQALTHTQRLAGLGTLTASIAHELTNPISIITATCHAMMQEIRDESLEPEQVARYTKMIERSAWRCVRLTDALRTYTHQGKLQMAITNFETLVDDALVLVQQQFRKQFNIRIDTSLDENHRTIVCDPNRMTQVLVNLLTNARDAMLPNGGTITIRSSFVSPKGLKKLTPPAYVDPFPEAMETVGAFAFAIEDTGSGIDPDIMEDIFSPFFTTKQSGSGTGLGLYVAQEIIDEHNGRLWAENVPGKGARFTVLLPQQ